MIAEPKPGQRAVYDIRSAQLPASIRHMPRGSPAGNINLNVLTIAGLVAFVLIAVAIVLRTPLANVTASHRARIEYQAFQRRQDDRRKILEQTIDSELAAATAALERLTVSAASLQRYVQAAVGVPLESAITHPPISIRRAFLASSSFRAAWTELANATISPAQLNNLATSLADIATRLSQHAVRDSDRHELAQVMASIQTIQARIDALDLSFLHTNPTLDSQPSVKTIQATERR